MAILEKIIPDDCFTDSVRISRKLEFLVHLYDLEEIKTQYIYHTVILKYVEIGAICKYVNSIELIPSNLKPCHRVVYIY